MVYPDLATNKKYYSRKKYCLIRTRYIKANSYFLLPFLLWVVIGGILLFTCSKRDLFHFVNTHYSDWADHAFVYITMLGQAEVIIPCLLVPLLFPAYRNWWYVLMATLCNLIPFFLEQLLKSWFDHPRPRLLFYDRLWMHYQPEWPVYLSRGFPSGHSTGAFSFFCFLSLILPSKYRALGLLFFLAALSVCYSRMYLTAHFFDDVYAGSIIGTVCTLAVYFIMNNYKNFFYKKDTFNQ